MPTCKLPRHILALTMAASCIGSTALGAETKFADGFLNDRKNNNATLVVFVAGLAGEKTWAPFVNLIDSDKDLAELDYLVYYSPDFRDIDGNVNRLATLLGEVSSKYPNKIYVGHSIGGIIIKKLLLSQVGGQSVKPDLPKLVITYGTPFNTDQFSVSVFQRMGARVFWFSVPTLQREVFNIDRLREIKNAWDTSKDSTPLNRVRFVNVFGIEDTIARIDQESRSEVSVFIHGGHVQIASPNKPDDCSFIIFKALINDRAAELAKIPCASNDQR